MVQVSLAGTGAPVPAVIASGVQLEPLFLPFKILRDTRERDGGWRFSGLRGNSADKYRPLVFEQQEQYLRTADYTVEGCPVFVERKSVSDFISTVTHGHKNFRLEHERFAEIIAAGGTCCVVIEGDYSDIMDELEAGTSGRSVHPASIRGAVAKMPQEFQVPWHFMGNRRRAEEMAFEILRSGWERRQV